MWNVLEGRSADERIQNQIPRSKLTGYQTCNAASCRVFDPRGIRQISAQARLLGSLLAGIKITGKYNVIVLSPKMTAVLIEKIRGSDTKELVIPAEEILPQGYAQYLARVLEANMEIAKSLPNRSAWKKGLPDPSFSGNTWDEVYRHMQA